MAGVGDKGGLLSGGTGSLGISSIKFLDSLAFIFIGMTTPVVFFLMDFVILGF